MSLKQEKKTPAKKEAAKKLISSSVANYEHHPFFIKKAKAAKDLLSKVGLPQQLTKKA